MRTARRISQIVFLIFFIWLFIRAAFPYETSIPSDLFLRASPLIALSTMIASRQFISSLILGLAVLLFTVPLGRIFCGWICPLGTIIDGSDNLIKRKKRKVGQREPVKYRWIKFGILVAVLVASLLSVQLIWFFDPIVLLTRTVTTTLFPIVTFFVEGLFNFGFNLRPIEDFLFSLYAFAQSIFLPIEHYYFQQAVFFLLFFIGILSFGLLTRRFWCRNLCPLGALLGIFSKYRLLKREVSEACTECGICQITCKMNAIEDDYTRNSPIECIECAECVAVCPPKAVTYRFGIHRGSKKIDLSRRRFIQSGIAGVVAVGAMGTGLVKRIAQGKAIRPPGALEEESFLDRCVRCQECVRICSTTGACLQPAFLESGLQGIWTPISIPRQGYCEFNCILCSEVCPSGAIHKLDLEVKQKTKMGLAYFDKSRCIPWYKHIDCLVCEEHCPLPEKAIKFDNKEVVRPDGSRAVVKYPYVDEALCIGCGICVTKCPVVGEAGIFVTNAEEQRWSETA